MQTRAPAYVQSLTPRFSKTPPSEPPVLAGRELDARDSERAPKVAVINEAMARRYFANRSPIGERFGYARPNVAIVGVVRDARVTNVRDAAVPMAYYAM